MKNVQEPTLRKTLTVEPTVRKTLTVEPTVKKALTVATSRIPWRPLIGLVAAIVLMSMVVPSEAQLKHVPPAASSFTVLHTFAGPPTDGERPLAGLIRDGAGNLYGTTVTGGAYGGGVVFKLSATGTYTVLHSFTGGGTGGIHAGLVRDAADNLYGTTEGAGAFGRGVVFELNPSGTETVLHSFNGADGELPSGGLLRDAAGNLYGTAGGGASGDGVVFELIRCSSVPSGYEPRVRVLYSFTGGADGFLPLAGVIRDGEGNLYGTTYFGGTKSGACQNGGCGVVFKLSPTGIETVLHTFDWADGGNPVAGLVQDAAGNLYGTTSGGGVESSACQTYSGGCGVVFELIRGDSGYDFKVLYTFTGGADGGGPGAGLIRDPAGNLYGTASVGGSGGVGVVFKLTP
jgi:uncharacterized repeat protein (TIGR03803 family)